MRPDTRAGNGPMIGQEDDRAPGIEKTVLGAEAAMRDVAQTGKVTHPFFHKVAPVDALVANPDGFEDVAVLAAIKTKPSAALRAGLDRRSIRRRRGCQSGRLQAHGPTLCP